MGLRLDRRSCRDPSGDAGQRRPHRLGVLASIIGYILSRRAYRLSLEHPDRYPRYRLSRAARFVSFGFLAPIALYVAIVLLVLLLLGGIRIT